MIEMSLAEVARVTGGRLHRATGTERVTAVEFDSRKVGHGGLFLALPGERADGHDFAAAAVAAGAVAVLAAREVDAPAVVVPAAPDGPGGIGAVTTGSYLAATDPDGSGAAVLAALARLAAHNVVVLSDAGLHRRRGHRQFRQDLDEGPASRGPGPARPDKSPRPDRSTTSWACPGPHYARTRPPATWCWSSSPARAGTSPRCAVAQPRIGVVLTVGRAHLGEFGSPEAIAEAKGRAGGGVAGRRGGGAQRRRPGRRRHGNADAEPAS
jgi:UDP-N-acetylmuramoyl-tripeptide--D-alanyl-D-alanine ligase